MTILDAEYRRSQMQRVQVLAISLAVLAAVVFYAVFLAD